MTPSQKETLGFATAGGLLAILYAIQKSGAGGGGLGQAGQPATFTWNNGLSTATAPNGGSVTIPPSTYYFLGLTGFQPTDWGESNIDNASFTGSNVPLCGSCDGYSNTLPTNWQPQYSAAAVAANAKASYVTLEGQTADSYGQFTFGAVSPTTPGNYTVLVAVNGTIVFTCTLVVSGGSGGFTPGIKPNTPGYSSTFPAVPVPTTVPVQTTSAPVPTSTPPSASGAGSTTAGGATVPMVPASGSSTDSMSSLTGMLEGTIFGLPTWAVLAAGAGLVWYLTSRR